MRRLIELSFDNTYARLPAAFYSKVSPTKFSVPYLVSFNPAAAELIELDPREAERPEFVEYFSGGRALPGAEPLAMLYAGHQFGSYVPQLGDGRAILLGEVRNARGAKWDLHLKGAGQTPYSRGFDGRAVLRSTIREYLCGEAMHALGIPTSRALCIVGSDEPVRRETIETAAMLVRMSESHVRFGTFEVFYYRQQFERVRELADYCIANHFPELAGAEDRYRQFLLEAGRRTARLIARWQAVGFAHGVMNTDNMSVLGLTLDYGPFGFMDDYHAAFVCNHSDYSGRYAFDRQPAVGLWNLSCLAQALSPLITRDDAHAALDAYQPAFAAHYGELMRAKLGFDTEAEADAELLLSLLGLLETNAVDYTNFFRRLGNFKTTDDARNDELRDMFYEPAAFDAWAARYRARLLSETSEDAARKSRMDEVNPKYVLRNYLAQQAITAATERRDYTEIERLLDVLRAPFAEQPAQERYAAPPPDWGKRLAVSCSS
ncbi:MAG TPA: YdiU family protein [Pyrinomonadaceae bacterium]|nr:YdiU family protein [Pyrinomonadaceae bacterium]